MVLDGDGKQKHVSGPLKPQDLLAKLKTGTHPWDGKLVPLIRVEYGGLCVLECKACRQPLSANNPSKSFREHKCKGHNLAKAAAMRASPRASPTTRGATRRREEDEGAQAMGSSMTPPKRARESTLDSFAVRPVQLEQVHRMLAIHVIMKERPFEDVECPALRKAFLATVGVKLKGEKAFCNTWYFKSQT
jgi:hypothetical protein